MDSYEETIKKLECPFNWMLDEIPDRRSSSDLIERLKKKEGDVSEPWVHLCINFNFAYLHFENKKQIKAEEVLEDLYQLLSTSEDELVMKYKPAFRVIYYASRAVLAWKSSNLPEAKQFVNHLTPDLSDAQLSAISAIKANIFLEYGVNGSYKAMDFAKEAIKLNPQEGEWHLLKGILYSRFRHYDRVHMPTPEELSHLEMAYDLTRSAPAAIFLANSYIEKAKCMKYNAKMERTVQSVRPIVDEIFADAKRLIMFAIEKNESQSVHMNIRCAYGLVSLHPPHYDLKKAKELLNEALNQSPLNTMGNRLAGDICMWEKEPLYAEALQHYKIAASDGVYSAELLIFEINIKLGKNPDAEEFYSRLLESYKEKNYQLQTFIHATEYYLFFRRDLFMALPYFIKTVELDPNYHALTRHFVKFINCNVNFYEVISEEVNIAEQRNLDTSENQKVLLKKTLSEIRNHYPKMAVGKGQENWRERRWGHGNWRDDRSGSTVRGGGRGNGDSSLNRRRGRNSNQVRSEPPLRQEMCERLGSSNDGISCVELLKRLGI